MKENKDFLLSQIVQFNNATRLKIYISFYYLFTEEKIPLSSTNVKTVCDYLDISFQCFWDEIKYYFVKMGFSKKEENQWYFYIDNKDKPLITYKQKQKIIEQAIQEYPDMNYSGIYALTLDDKIVYIGQSIHCAQRFGEHKFEIETNNNSKKYSLLKEALQNNHIIKGFIIERVDEYYLDNREQYWIKKLTPILNIKMNQNYIKNLSYEDFIKNIEDMPYYIDKKGVLCKMK